MDDFEWLASELTKDHELARLVREHRAPEYMASYMDDQCQDDDICALMHEYLERFSPERMLRMIEVMQRALDDFNQAWDSLCPSQRGGPFTEMMLKEQFDRGVKPIMQMYGRMNDQGEWTA